MRALIDYSELTKSERDDLFRLACDIKAHTGNYAHALSGKVMATLFYEPSTRTRLSFETAMHKLGGSVIGFADPNASSVSKGESLRDTVKIIANYADVTVIRSPLEGAAYAASLYSSAPVVNAGDGSHLHPTQTMTDLFTIRERFGGIDGLSIGVCGDLYNGRTVHSLLRACAENKNVKFYLISTPELTVPDYIRAALSSCEVYDVPTLEECIGSLDILYMTRIQRERFKSYEQYEKQAHVYVLDPPKIALAKLTLAVLHPLPKVDEIHPAVDDDPRALYFEQAANGVYIRMALVLRLCEQGRLETEKYPLPESRFCENPRCVSNYERYLPRMEKNGRCAYCETEPVTEERA